MKKIMAFLIAIVLLVGITSCTNDINNTSSTNSHTTSNTSSSATSKVESNNESIDESTPTSLLKGPLEDILAAVYDGIKDNEMKNSLVEGVVTTQIDPTNCGYYFGVDSLDFKEGIASEFEMGGGYSVCLIRAKSMADVESLKTTIKDNVDPFKWVCMGVDKDKVVVDNIDDVIILIMYDKSEILHEAFLELK